MYDSQHNISLLPKHIDDVDVVDSQLLQRRELVEYPGGQRREVVLPQVTCGFGFSGISREGHTLSKGSR